MNFRVLKDEHLSLQVPDPGIILIDLLLAASWRENGFKKLLSRDNLGGKKSSTYLVYVKGMLHAIFAEKYTI